MIIGVISDTHDRLESIDRAFSFFLSRGASTVFHAGDWKLPGTLEYFATIAAEQGVTTYAVLGNNDSPPDAFVEAAAPFPAFHLSVDAADVTIDGVLFLMTHGHKKLLVKQASSDPAADVVILGHSHKPLIEGEHPLIINPGSTAFAIPRNKTWLPTVALFDTTTGQATLHTLES